MAEPLTNTRQLPDPPRAAVAPVSTPLRPLTERPLVAERDAARDTQLLERIGRDQDIAALDELYRVWSVPLFSYALKVLNTREDAEEVTQDLFGRIWVKAAIFDRQRSQPFTWAMMMCRGLTLDRLRKLQRRRRECSLEAMEESHSTSVLVSEANLPPPSLHDADDIEAALEALRSLNPAERECLELCLFGDLTHPEIAEKLQTPLGTVKSRLRRGLNHLRELLKHRRQSRS